MSVPLVLATRLDGPSERAVGTAAALAATWSECADDRPVVVFEVAQPERRPRPTLLCSKQARELEELLASEGFGSAARGKTCWVWADDGERPWVMKLAALVELCGELAAGIVAWLRPHDWRIALDSPDVATGLAVIQCGDRRQRNLLSLVARELVERKIPLRVLGEGPGLLATRRAMAGVSPGSRVLDRFGRVMRPLFAERGQSLVLIMGLCAVILFVALALAALGGAVTGKARMQRAADLAALAAVGSMHDDLPGLMAPEMFPDGTPNSGHLGRGEYLERARAAAADIAARNGAGESNVMVTFPDGQADPPLRARVRVAGELQLDEYGPAADGNPVVVSAEAAVEAVDGGGPGMLPGVASGGGYSGPLEYRMGVPMRPDVAAAFDRLSLAAAGAGHRLLITSGFRSDAQQAKLFAARPDPKWVAPPGQSLHRCGTELDLAPASAYGWLAANASRFGFVKRYAWEPWHFGFVGGSSPCASGGSAEPLRSDSVEPPSGLPGWVPGPLGRVISATAARHGLPAVLIAAQLKAESGFNPRAVSPAGALGVAQFMPGTAAEWGLVDPFDPVESIRAQGRFMANLLQRFGSPSLALAAYNAGPGAVAACSCIPSIPETRAYVARILALIDASGGGGLAGGGYEIRLVS